MLQHQCLNALYDIISKEGLNPKTISLYMDILNNCMYAHTTTKSHTHIIIINPFNSGNCNDNVHTIN